MIRVLPAIIELALAIYCVIDCIQSSDAEVRNLPRWAWIILIIVVPLIGGIAWLFVGRPLRSASGHGRWGDARGGFGGSAGGPRSGPPVGPDDDTEFLAGLRRADHEHDDVLRQWEADLSRREEELRRGQAPPPPDDEAPPAGR